MDKSDRLTPEMRYSRLDRDLGGHMLSDRLVPLLIDAARNEPCLSNDELVPASRLGYSTSQLRRICNSVLGEPIGSFVRRIRLERAAGRLSTEGASISAIWEEAGYLSAEAFSKAFHRHFDCSPTTFRALNRSSKCLMPGYLISCGITDRPPRSVRVAVGGSRTVSFLFDGPVFLARVLPDGAIDWLPR